MFFSFKNDESQTWRYMVLGKKSILTPCDDATGNDRKIKFYQIKQASKIIQPTKFQTCIVSKVCKILTPASSLPASWYDDNLS